MPDAEVQDRVEAGLDALGTPTNRANGPRWRRFARAVLPPVGALVILVAIWQALWAAAFWPEAQLPAPLAVWSVFVDLVRTGQIFEVLWTSISRAVLGFLAGLLIATPLGLLVAKVRVVRSAIGPLLSGLQSL